MFDHASALEASGALETAGIQGLNEGDKVSFDVEEDRKAADRKPLGSRWTERDTISVPAIAEIRIVARFALDTPDAAGANPRRFLLLLRERKSHERR